MTQGWRATISLALVLSAGSLFVSGLVFRHGNDQDKQINGNRVEQTRRSCHERNHERLLLRRKFARPLIINFKAQRDQTERVPDAAFRQFEVTKAESLDLFDTAIAGLKQARGQFGPLDCKARVRAVRDSLD